MSEPDENQRRYKWPWFALAAIVLFIALAILWVTLAAEKVESQRNYNTPLPAGTPAR